jgi:UDP-glucose:(heptosyl)LPS alpha-1,3-glucosyltransferase
MAMKLAFILFDYFPFGGLQRDGLRIARCCASRGHAVTILARTWEGAQPEGAGVSVELFGRRGFSNASRNRRFIAQLTAVLPTRAFDGVVGFNKVPGVDVYYGADPCYAAKVRRLRPAWYRWLPRVRYFEAMERGVFGRGQKTELLLLKDTEIPAYQEFYGTEIERFHVLPPGIARQALGADERARIRERVRQQNGWSAGDPVLLFVGSGFRIKGLDRVLEGLASLSGADQPRARLVVIGQGKPGPFARQAERLGVAGRVQFLGGRHDVLDFMIAADLLVHPAYSENTGTILLEALTVGLPVLTTDVCGFAFHIVKAQAGVVLASPFRQGQFNHELARILHSEEMPAWRSQGLAYAGREDLYSCDLRATEIIEQTIQRKQQAGAAGKL